MAFQTHNPRKTDEWTNERMELIIKLDAENVLSRAEIAQELRNQTDCCFTRNAVIGKLRRLGVPLKDEKIAREIWERAKPVYIPRMKAERAKPVLVRIEPEPPAAPQEPLGLVLSDLNDQTCRFPTNKENAPLAFCGHPVTHGSYCGYHGSICYNPPNTRRELRS